MLSTAMEQGEKVLASQGTMLLSSIHRYLGLQRWTDNVMKHCMFRQTGVRIYLWESWKMVFVCLKCRAVAVRRAVQIIGCGLVHCVLSHRYENLYLRKLKDCVCLKWWVIPPNRAVQIIGCGLLCYFPSGMRNYFTIVKDCVSLTTVYYFRQAWRNFFTIVKGCISCMSRYFPTDRYEKLLYRHKWIYTELVLHYVHWYRHEELLHYSEWLYPLNAEQ